MARRNSANAETRTVLGVEIGDRTIRVVEVARAGKVPDVRSRAEAVRPADDARVGGALRTLLEEQGIRTRDAALAVPTPQAFLRELTFDSREHKARRAAEVRLSVPEDDLVFNYVVQGKTPDGRRTVLMVALPRTEVDRGRRMATDAGLSVLSMAAAPLGLYAAHRLDRTVPQRSLVVAVHGVPGAHADLALLDGGGLRWAEATDIIVPTGEDPSVASDFWWAVTRFIGERNEVLQPFAGEQPVGLNLLHSGVPKPDQKIREMLQDHLGTAHFFTPGDAIAPELRVAYGMALMELGLAVPADVSFHPSMAAVRKAWIQNAVLAAGAIGFAYAAFLAHLAVVQRDISAVESETARIEQRVSLLEIDATRYRQMSGLLAAVQPVRTRDYPLERIRSVVERAPEQLRIERLEISGDGSFEFDFRGVGRQAVSRDVFADMPGLKLGRVQRTGTRGRAPLTTATGRWMAVEAGP